MKYDKTIIYILFVMAFCLSHSTVNSQNKNIDFLLTLIKTDKQDTNKVIHLNKLSLELIDIGEYNKALTYSNEALALASSPIIAEGSHWASGMAKAYNTIGIIYDDQSDYPEALKNYFNSLKIREQIGDQAGIAATLSNIGLVYGSQGNYFEAYKNHFASLKLKKKLNDKQGIANSHNNIGLVFYAQGNYPEALNNQLAALKFHEEINNKIAISMSFNNIGIIYNTQKNYSEALKNHRASLKIREEINDKKGIANSYNNIGNVYKNQFNYSDALTNYFFALKIKKEINDKKGIAFTLGNIGDTYYAKENYAEAQKYMLASLKILEEIGDKSELAQCHNNLGAVYIKLNSLKTAQDCLNSALKISMEMGSKDDIKDSYLLLSDLDSAHANWHDAYKHHKLFILYRDSIDNEETKKRIIESTLTNKFEKKELQTKTEQDKKDAIATVEKRKEKIIRYSISAGLFLALLLAIFIFRGYKQKRKANILLTQQKAEVEKQKELVEEKNKIVEEKHKEITDSINYAERIQRSFLASQELLTENLNEHFVLFQPKDVVSGDFYWASKLSNGNFALVTADSTGHGVPGAIMSILNISSIEKAVEQGAFHPSEIFGKTRKTIIERLKKDGSLEGGKDGMDASILCFDFQNKKFTYAAANNPIWVVRQNELIKLKPDKMPVGKHDKDQTCFTQQEFQFQKDDTIYTLTDGFPDQFGGPNGKKFMSKQLKEFLITISTLPLPEQKEKLSAAFNDWKGNFEQVDDLCLIGIKV